MNKRKLLCISGLCMAAIGAVMVNIFFVSVFRVSGDSMEPTLKDGSYVIVRKNAEIQRGNVVLAYNQMGDYIIKRVIGLGGDYVKITKNSVYVNGELFDCRENHQNGEFVMDIYVPNNSVFLLGKMGTRKSGSTGVNEPEDGDFDVILLGNEPMKQS